MYEQVNLAELVDPTLDRVRNLFDDIGGERVARTSAAWAILGHVIDRLVEVTSERETVQLLRYRIEALEQRRFPRRHWPVAAEEDEVERARRL